MPSKLQQPPQNAAEVRALMAREVVRNTPDKDRLRFLSELLASFEKQEAAAETLAVPKLAAVTAERDALAAKVAEIQPLADRLPGVEAELNELSANLDAKKAEFVGRAAEERFKAEAALNRLADREREIEVRYKSDGLAFSVAEWQRRIAEQPMPDFWAEESRKHSSLFWESWPDFSETPKKAQVWCALAKTYANPDAEFKTFAIKILSQVGSQYTDQPTVTEHLEAKASFCKAAAERWRMLDDIERDAHEIKTTQYAAWIARNNSLRAASERQAQLLGLGREELRSERTQSNVPLSEHVIGCCCTACGGPAPRSNSLETL